MDIIRVVQNGVEFYTVVADGESGMSQSGLGRLVGEHHHQIGRIASYLENFGNTEVVEKPKRAKGRPPKNKPEAFYEDFPKKGDPLAKKWMSKQLEPFIHNVPTLAQSGTMDGKDMGNIKIYRHDFCAAVIRHFAYRGSEIAQYSLDKFSDRGILDWIHEITGWQKESKPKTRAEELGIFPQHVEVRFDRHIFYNGLLNKEITAPMYRVYLYFLDCHLIHYIPTIAEVCQHAQVAKHHLYDLIQKMRPYGLVPIDFEIDDSTRSFEAQIRTKMHKKLGGEVEVQTIHGPIDLLTLEELIEIKKIEDWKEGFGQILVKCKTYPQHAKRLHLFGQSNRTLRNIKAACKPFDISVSFETIATLAR